MIMVDKSKRKNNAGRPSIDDATKDKVVKMYNDSIPVKKICDACQISLSSLYRIIRERTISEDVLMLRDVKYTIFASDVIIGYLPDKSFGIYTKIHASTLDQNVDYEMREIHICSSTNDDRELHPTGVSNFRELKGTVLKQKHFGNVYVVEHEYIQDSTYEIVDMYDNMITIHWYGTLDVFWNDKFGRNVPFDMTFTTNYEVQK